MSGEKGVKKGSKTPINIWLSYSKSNPNQLVLKTQESQVRGEDIFQYYEVMENLEEQGFYTIEKNHMLEQEFNENHKQQIIIPKDQEISNYLEQVGVPDAVKRLTQSSLQAFLYQPKPIEEGSELYSSSVPDYVIEIKTANVTASKKFEVFLKTNSIQEVTENSMFSSYAELESSSGKDISADFRGQRFEDVDDKNQLLINVVARLRAVKELENISSSFEQEIKEIKPYENDKAEEKLPKTESAEQVFKELDRLFVEATLATQHSSKLQSTSAVSAARAEYAEFSVHKAASAIHGEEMVAATSVTPVLIKHFECDDYTYYTFTLPDGKNPIYGLKKNGEEEINLLKYTGDGKLLTATAINARMENISGQYLNYESTNHSSITENEIITWANEHRKEITAIEEFSFTDSSKAHDGLGLEYFETQDDEESNASNKSYDPYDRNNLIKEVNEGFERALKKATIYSLQEQINDNYIAVTIYEKTSGNEINPVRGGDKVLIREVFKFQQGSKTSPSQLFSEIQQDENGHLDRAALERGLEALLINHLMKVLNDEATLDDFQLILVPPNAHNKNLMQNFVHTQLGNKDSHLSKVVDNFAQNYQTGDDEDKTMTPTKVRDFIYNKIHAIKLEPEKREELEENDEQTKEKTVSIRPGRGAATKHE